MNKYAVRSTLKVVKDISKYKAGADATTNLTGSELTDLGLVVIRSYPDSDSSKVMEMLDTPLIDSDELVLFSIRDKTDDEKLNEIRSIRNSLLTDTDWTGLSDVTMSDDMITYRQALRDLPASVDVDSPVYPTKP